MTVPHVIVVVLTRNGWADTAACLESLSGTTYSNAEIVIVDNGSTDGTPQSAAAQFPALTVVENGANLGFAEGNNVGLRYALERGAAYVLLLNNDTVVAPESLTHLVEAAEREPRAALLGPLVYHFDEPTIIQSAGGGQRDGWRFFHRGQDERDEGQFHLTESVAWLTGCAVLARGQTLETLGLLNPDFFLYGEELDWCLRAREAGYSVLFVPQAKVWHKGVQRDYRPNPRVTYYSVRNELLLLKKHRAGLAPLASAFLRDLRTLASWSVRPKWRDRRAHRQALAKGMCDFMRGRLGAADS